MTEGQDYQESFENKDGRNEQINPYNPNIHHVDLNSSLDPPGNLHENSGGYFQDQMEFKDSDQIQNQQFEYELEKSLYQNQSYGNPESKEEENRLPNPYPDIQKHPDMPPQNSNHFTINDNQSITLTTSIYLNPGDTINQNEEEKKLISVQGIEEVKQRTIQQVNIIENNEQNKANFFSKIPKINSNINEEEDKNQILIDHHNINHDESKIDDQINLASSLEIKFSPTVSDINKPIQEANQNEKHGEFPEENQKTYKETQKLVQFYPNKNVNENPQTRPEVNQANKIMEEIPRDNLATSNVNPIYTTPKTGTSNRQQYNLLPQNFLQNFIHPNDLNNNSPIFDTQKGEITSTSNIANVNPEFANIPLIYSSIICQVPEIIPQNVQIDNNHNQINYFPPKKISPPRRIFSQKEFSRLPFDNNNNQRQMNYYEENVNFHIRKPSEPIILHDITGPPYMQNKYPIINARENISVNPALNNQHPNQMNMQIPPQFAQPIPGNNVRPPQFAQPPYRETSKNIRLGTFTPPPNSVNINHFPDFDFYYNENNNHQQINPNARPIIDRNIHCNPTPIQYSRIPVNPIVNGNPYQDGVIMREWHVINQVILFPNSSPTTASPFSSSPTQNIITNPGVAQYSSAQKMYNQQIIPNYFPQNNINITYQQLFQAPINNQRIQLRNQNNPVIQHTFNNYGYPPLQQIIPQNVTTYYTQNLQNIAQPQNQFKNYPQQGSYY